jgi:hypothetical protein
MLPEFTDRRATEAPVNPLLPGRDEDKMREVALDVSLGSGAGAFKAAKAFHLVANKLIIGRVLKRQELTKEGMDPRRPETSAVTATCSRLIGLTVAKPAGSQPIEPGPANPELRGSTSCIQQPRVEVFEGSLDELWWQAMENLLLFKSSSSTAQTDLRNQIVEHLARCLSNRRAASDGRLSVSLRYAPASYEATVGGGCHTRNLTEVYFCSVSVYF